MGLFFNRLPEDITAALTAKAARAHCSVEEVAVEALRRGLAFSQEAVEDTDVLESAQFGEALHAFADMERD